MIMLVATASGLFLNGCNGQSQTSVVFDNSSVEGNKVMFEYEGYKEGCKKDYDPLWCDDKYKKEIKE